uniref:Phage tail protein n=1 Tax=Escherichia coli TaxID=562 RepID=A0A3L0W1T3_ECOLX
MSAIYFAILTDAGQAKMANAIALGIPLKITNMAVGDGNGQPVTPNAAQTVLIRENRRAPLNTLFQDPLNQAQLVAEQIIPEDVGDWWIREVGLFSEDGTLIAVANCPDTYKPLLSSGAGRTQVIRLVLVVSDTSAVELKIDPSVVLATRQYVDKSVFPRLKSGVALPTADIGPIWHDDYASIMTWQAFTANSANYQGYASQLIGSLLLDTQPTARPGYIKSGVQNLSRATYAALRAWAMHNGRMVAPGAWLAGTIQCADNADGTTFRVFDVRGEFMRAWDDGRGVDPGRQLGSAQGDAIRNIVGTANIGLQPSAGFGLLFNTISNGALTHAETSVTGRGASTTQSTQSTGNVGIKIDASLSVPTAPENRPRNTALLAAIKY